MMCYLQVTSEILERDAKVKKIILDIYDCVLTMFKSEAFKKVFDSESSMYTETVENHRKQLERKEYPIVVAGKITNTIIYDKVNKGKIHVTNRKF